jgi:hypothetical protein
VEIEIINEKQFHLEPNRLHSAGGIYILEHCPQIEVDR